MSKSRKTRDRTNSKPAKGRTVRILNLRLLATTAIVAGLIAGAGYGWRLYQLRRTAGIYLERAEAAKAEKKWPEVAAFLERYLDLRPDDADARIQWAEAIDESLKTQPRKGRAIDAYLQAIAVAPDDAVARLRGRAAELHLESGDPAQAAEAAEAILAENPAVGSRVLALALLARFQQGKLEAAGQPGVLKWFVDAVRLNPQDVQLATILAHLYREEDRLCDEETRALTVEQRADRANAVMDNLVAQSPDSPEALLARHRYRRRYAPTDATSRAAGVEGDLATALERWPDDVNVLMEAGAQAHQDALAIQQRTAAGDSLPYRQACSFYQQVIKQSPDARGAYFALAELQLAYRDYTAAEQTSRRLLSLSERPDAIALRQLAEALTRNDKLREADQVLSQLQEVVKALELSLSKEARRRFERGYAIARVRWLLRAGETAQALSTAQAVAAADERERPGPREEAESLALLGEVHTAATQWDLAAKAYEGALHRVPESAALAQLAAQAWEQAGQPEKAVAVQRRAKESPTSSEFALGLARMLLAGEAARAPADRQWAQFDEALAQAKAAAQHGLDDPWRVALLEADSVLLKGRSSEDRDAAVRTAKSILASAEAEHAGSAELLRQLVGYYERLRLPDDADRVLAKWSELNHDATQVAMLKSSLLASRRQFAETRRVLDEALEAVGERSDPASRENRFLLRAQIAQTAFRAGQPKETFEIITQLQAERPADIGLALQLGELVLLAHGVQAPEKQWIDDWAKKADRVEYLLQTLEGTSGTEWRLFRARRLAAEAAGPEDAKLAEALRLIEEIRPMRSAWPALALLEAEIRERQNKPAEAVVAYEKAIRLGANNLAIYERLFQLLAGLGRAADAEKLMARLEEQGTSLEGADSLAILRAGMRGQTDVAIDIARQAAEGQPEEAAPRMRLARLLAIASQHAESADEFKKAFAVAKEDRDRAAALLGAVVASVEAKQPQAARTTLETLSADLVLDEPAKSLVLARAHEALGDATQAEKLFRQAAEKAPDDEAVQMRLVQFLITGEEAKQLTEAETVLNRLVEKFPDSGPARRALAMVLARRGGEEEWKRAESLLADSGAEATTAAMDQRLQAVLLSRRGGEENRAKARAILTQLIATPGPYTEGDRLLLARLYEQDGMFAEAREAYLAMADRPDAEPRQMAAYVEFLLRQRSEETAAWIDKLEAKSPDGLLGTAVRARWLQSKGEADKIAPLVEVAAAKTLQTARNDTERAARAAEVGSLYVSLGMLPQAVPWYRKAVDRPDADTKLTANYVELLIETGDLAEAQTWLDKFRQASPDDLTGLGLKSRWLKASEKADEIAQAIEPEAAKLLADCQGDPQREARLALGMGAIYAAVELPQQAASWYERLRTLTPERWEPLVLALGRQGQMPEAVRLCAEAAQSDKSSRPARLLLRLLQELPGEVESAEAKTLLRETEEKHAEDVALLADLANYHVVRGRNEDAARLYEKALRLRPTHPLLHNNLAAVLGELPQRRETALQHAEKAIRYGGPQPNFLDTQASILLRDGKAEAAVAVLEQAVAVPYPDPRHLLHLASAYLQTGKSEQAREAYEKAIKGRVDRQVITHLDRQDLAQLEKQFKP